ncbi:MAG: iron dependent repressor, metal binding and dimerization domain protein [Acutalibacteraceae bacterium]
MGVDREHAVEDACRIEHVISAESFEAIKRHAAQKNTE